MKSTASMTLVDGTWMSLPVRGAWIEMLRQRDGDGGDLVAPRAGSVD